MRGRPPRRLAAALAAAAVLALAVAAPAAASPQTATVDAGGGLRCRATPGLSGTVLALFADGATATLRGADQDGWTPVVCPDGEDGWASSDYLGAGGDGGSGGGVTLWTTADLRLRAEPSTSADVLLVAPEGTAVAAGGRSQDGFDAVSVDGQDGWMWDGYLTEQAPAGDGGGTDGGGGQGQGQGQAVVDYALGYLGYPYVPATHGPDSFDCSGFTHWVVAHVLGEDIGYDVPSQWDATSRVAQADLQPGDLVFFHDTADAGLSHVGIYVGGGQFVNAENEDTGVVVADLSGRYWQDHWSGGGRL